MNELYIDQKRILGHQNREMLDLETKKRPHQLSFFGFLIETGNDYPTDPFTNSALRNPSYDVSELHKIRRSPDCEALKL